jgi:hypothetical protein
MGRPIPKEQDLDQIEKYFLTKVKTRKVIPSYADLLLYAKRNKLKFKPSQLERIRKLRQKWKFMAIHKPFLKSKAYSSLAYPKVGIVQIDLAEYGKSVKAKNDNHAGINLYIFSF